MLTLRHWSIHHAGFLNRLYRVCLRGIEAAAPVWRLIGYDRLDGPFAAVERVLKGAMFGCRMCGRCDLSSTGMACPMTCPKQMRNGPCGGVRTDGSCEIVPDMRCVWVGAWQGSQQVDDGGSLSKLLPPTDHSLRGSSAWINLLREKAGSSDRDPVR